MRDPSGRQHNSVLCVFRLSAPIGSYRPDLRQPNGPFAPRRKQPWRESDPFGAARLRMTRKGCATQDDSLGLIANSRNLYSGLIGFHTDFTPNVVTTMVDIQPTHAYHADSPQTVDVRATARV